MIYFLASIPRSGSTLLASLLGQRDDTYVSNTSNLSNIMGAVCNAFETDPATKASSYTQDQLIESLSGVLHAQYNGRKEEYIFDKGRAWPNPKIMDTVSKVQGEGIKIVATVRPIAECIASFYLISQSDVPIKEWVKSSHLMNHLMESYQHLASGYEHSPESFCLVEYENLVNNTQGEMDRIASFIGSPAWTHSMDIEQVGEDDNVWNIKDLHKLNTRVETSTLDPMSILGEDIYHEYSGGEFWNDNPEPDEGNQPLDLSLAAALLGNFKKSEEILREVIKKDPENNRAQFNLGLHEMMKGNHVRGHKQLDMGRPEKVYGNHNPKTAMPLWDGKAPGTVIMDMEGGFGDQFHFIRYAKDVVDRGNTLIVSGSEFLATIMRSVEGVDTFIMHEGMEYTYHDYWFPAMSAPAILDIEYSDVRGGAYIPRTCPSEGKIGVKWQGNGTFEHEQHRLFSKEMMWDIVEGFDVVSLQIDDNNKENDGPDWMEKPSLETWNHTINELSKCDLVLTSCTGLAHLAAGIGIETWIIIPIMPYFIWAVPGSKSPHYDSVTLFRQDKYGNWDKPFWEMKKEFRKRMWNKKEIPEELYFQI